jgi:hypothetical protein
MGLNIENVSGRKTPMCNIQLGRVPYNAMVSWKKTVIVHVILYQK